MSTICPVCREIGFGTQCMIGKDGEVYHYFGHKKYYAEGRKRLWIITWCQTSVSQLDNDRSIINDLESPYDVPIQVSNMGLTGNLKSDTRTDGTHIDTETTPNGIKNIAKLMIAKSAWAGEQPIKNRTQLIDKLMELPSHLLIGRKYEGRAFAEGRTDKALEELARPNTDCDKQILNLQLILKFVFKNKLVYPG